jgi:hypothetical protein
MARRSSNGIRNLKSAGNSAAKFTHNVTEKAAVGLFRWATTDHSNMGKALANMPSMGFMDSLRYIFRQFLSAIFGAVLTGILAFVLIAFVIPFLLFG